MIDHTTIKWISWKERIADSIKESIAGKTATDPATDSYSDSPSCRRRRRKGSIAVEAAIAFTTSILILVIVLGTLLSVIVSDISDWEALHTKDFVSGIYGGLEPHPNLNLTACLSAANLDFSRRLSEKKLSKNKLVYGAADDYGFLKLKFEYKTILKGIRESESIVIPAGGIHASDGVDFSKEIVYITRTGERYHEGNCFHLRKSKFGIELEDAKSKGYTPCKHCH